MNTAEKRRAKMIISRLKTLFPNSGTSLLHTTRWQFLVAVMLSAQCTDKKVNEVTKPLFQKYRTLDDYVRADRKTFERAIIPTGFYKTKAKNILATAKIIQTKHHGRIPRTMKELVSLPGVGRKTANVVLGNAFGIAEGIAVDTHVKRLSYQLALTNSLNPATIERDLMNIIPKSEWSHITNLLIAYGRTYCPARKHDHTQCPLKNYYRET